MRLSLKRILSLTGNLLALVGIVFVTRAIYVNLDRLPSVSADIVTSGVGLASLVILFVSFLSLTYAWRRILNHGHGSISMEQAFIIMGRSQIAKYLPGNVFHYVGRLMLSGLAGLPSEEVLLSIGIETVCILLTAIVITCSGMLFYPDAGLVVNTVPKALIGEIQWIVGVTVLIFIIGATSFRSAREWVRARRGYLDPRFLVIIMSLYAAALLLHGPILYMILSFIYHVDSPPAWYELSYGFTIAWVLGFLVPGAPGGIGIREAVILALFGPSLGNGIAAGLAVALRVMTTVSDVIVYLTALVLQRRWKLKSSEG
jgi:uncharacterized membrane protein YbhN (UPF0104 family)